MLTFDDKLDIDIWRRYNKLDFNIVNALTETNGLRVRMLQRAGGWCESAQFRFIRITPEQNTETKLPADAWAFLESKYFRYAPLQAEDLMES